jgi:hypothetical protein
MLPYVHIRRAPLFEFADAAGAVAEEICCNPTNGEKAASDLSSKSFKATGIYLCVAEGMFDIFMSRIGIKAS